VAQREWERKIEKNIWNGKLGSNGNVCLNENQKNEDIERRAQDFTNMFCKGMDCYGIIFFAYFIRYVIIFLIDLNWFHLMFSFYLIFIHLFETNIVVIVCKMHFSILWIVYLIYLIYDLCQFE
jgi:hypothetical protein